METLSAMMYINTVLAVANSMVLLITTTSYFKEVLKVAHPKH